ncbi:MAG: allose kinase [Lachnospiraceae bacterium]|nr:allose kinase [Lachnospiraceae bacterium]
MKKRYALGIDIGGTNIRFGIVSNDFELICDERRSSQELLGKKGVEGLIEGTRDFLSRNARDIVVEGIGVDVPGPVSSDHNFVYSVPKLKGLQNVALGSALSEAVGIPVYVGHDVDFLMNYDIKKMNLDPNHEKTILGFYLGTGLGNGLYINGRLHAGKHGVTGELGHAPLYGVTDVCDCGLEGCTEIRTSGKALAILAEQLFPDTYIGDIFTKHGDHPRIIQFVKEAALPMASEISILDPDYVILGGGVINMADFPIKMLEDEITRRTRHPLPAEDLHFLHATDGQNTGVIGGCIIVFDWLDELRKKQTLA